MNSTGGYIYVLYGDDTFGRDEAVQTLKERMRDEHGRLRRHLSLFVNEEDSRFLGGEDTKLSDGDIVHVIPALSGG